MVKFPDPDAATVRAATPDVKTLAQGTPLARVYATAGDHPTRWNEFRRYGPTNSRFDHHLPGRSGQAREQDRSVLYCAASAVTCMAEVFQQTRRIDRVRGAPWLVVFELARPVRLLDLGGAWPTRAGASMAINTGSRVRARQWAQCIYAAFDDLDGIHYPSSMHANQSAIVLNDRAARALAPQPEFNRALADDAMLDVLKHAAAALGYGLR